MFRLLLLRSPSYQSDKAFLSSARWQPEGPNKEIIERFDVPQPPRPVQERIADILSAFDNLIENNRRRMTLLEEAARQLYREWFVRLRFPGYEHTRITNGVPEGCWGLCVIWFIRSRNPDFLRGNLPRSLFGASQPF